VGTEYSEDDGDWEVPPVRESSLQGILCVQRKTTTLESHPRRIKNKRQKTIQNKKRQKTIQNKKRQNFFYSFIKIKRHLFLFINFKFDYFFM